MGSFRGPLGALDLRQPPQAARRPVPLHPQALSGRTMKGRREAWEERGEEGKERKGRRGEREEGEKRGERGRGEER